MDSARKRETGEEIVAEELLAQALQGLVDVDAMHFICLGCDAVMEPVACKSRMKTRPYFRAKGNHSSDCDIDGYEKLAKIGQLERVSNSDGFPVSYPNKLKLAEVREVVSSNNSNKQANILRNKSVTLTSKTEGTGKKHSRTAETIQPLARHYILFPHDRHLLLYVPEVNDSNYANVFQRLYYKEKFYYTQNKIYFGQLLFKNCLITNNSMRLPFTAGIWDDNRKPQKTYFLSVDLSSWSQSKKNYISLQIKYCIEEARDSLKETMKIKAWLFFLGKQDENDLFKFNLLTNDHRLICCLTSRDEVR